MVEDQSSSEHCNDQCPYVLQQLVGSPPLFPEEVWFFVLQYLDISDVSNCAMVCKQLYSVAMSRQLLLARFHNTISWLENEYTQRPSCRELYERHILLWPSPNIGLSHLKLCIKLQRTLRKDAVRRGLENRPTRQELIERGIIRHGGPLADRMCALERQKKIDVIRQFYNSSQRPSLDEAIRRGLVKPIEEEPKTVSILTRIFSYRLERSEEAHRSRRAEAPPRAKVYNMKKKFEQLANDQCSSSCNDLRPLTRQLTGVTQGAVAAVRQKFLSIA